MSSERKEFSASPLTKEKCAVTKQILETKYSNEALVHEALARNKKKKKVSSYRKLIARRKNINDFRTINIIGRGSFGEVRLVEEQKGGKPTGDYYALKLLRKSEMLRRKQVSHVRAERDILSLNNSEWIVQLKYAFQDEVFLYLVMEYSPGGDMMTWLINKEVFTEEETKFFIAQLVLAVDAIHNCNYVHRDLKPDNILLDVNGQIKISDFGLSKPYYGGDGEDEIREREKIKRLALSVDFDKIDCKSLKKSWKVKNRRKLLSSTVGSNGYISPEVLLKKGYGFSCDIWTIGIIMFEMLFGYPPFYDDSPVRTCHKIIRWKEFLEFPDDIQVSKEAEDLMRSLICDVEDRLTKKEILKHKFFEGVNWEKIRELKSPFIPQLDSLTDTKYFDKFEESPDYQTPKSSGNRYRNLLKKNENHVFYDMTYDKEMDEKLGLNKKKNKKKTRKRRESVKKRNYFPPLSGDINSVNFEE